MKTPIQRHKAGRPAVIKKELHPKIFKLYKQGYGYRAINTMLEKEDGVSASFMTVANIIRKQGLIR